MIASFEHNYIFVKTAKTAGTSVEIALSTFTGERDIITPISPEDEIKRLENPLARLPQNFCPYPNIEARYRTIVGTKEVAKIERFQRRHFRNMDMFRNHMTAADIRFRLDPVFFQSAFKFTVQRHPYDRLISLAYWNIRDSKNQNPQVGLAMNSILRKRALNNRRFYMIDGKIAVDFFIHYERLQDDLAVVGQKIGALDLWNQLPQTKSEHRTNRLPPQDVLTENQMARVRVQCKNEFETFGYEA